jgi:hypothetical protein
VSPHLPSILARHARRGAATQGELEEMRKAVWRAQAIVVIPLAELYDGPFKDQVAKWAQKTYGLRTSR